MAGEIVGEEAMVSFGKCLGEQLKEGAVVFLEGDLGAGKTTLSRGVLAAFGHTGAVKSPTYTLVEPYQFGPLTLCHFDLYRLGDPEELEYMGIRDYFVDGHLCLVEWPMRGAGFLPEPDLRVRISVGKVASGRRVSVQAETAKGTQIINRFAPEKPVC
ncbi:MAG: tRNA (adenosine(37)-N6)-threonylcarbamoyltransferase complex ATPase subunit type 1 TsaE [Porticoccaceae bacterium]|nr:tRNA (adenosine(37)-N6)-threonylcarbamoyltransferase complex ATPase subunit type 1 TsaE [Porticoccaceae bacterium]